MSKDKYADLREAIKGATPGPWEHDVNKWLTPQDVTIFHGEDYVVNVANGSPMVAFDASLDNARYIAAANPNAIAALLAERDAMREALQGVVALYDTDEGCRNLPQYRAAREALKKGGATD